MILTIVTLQAISIIDMYCTLYLKRGKLLGPWYRLQERNVVTPGYHVSMHLNAATVNRKPINPH
jgi:hypothetical protein